jgi:hypothetical protein
LRASVVGLGHRQRDVATGLVRTLLVVVPDVLREEVPEATLAQDQEVVQALRLGALNHRSA